MESLKESQKHEIETVKQSNDETEAPSAVISQQKTDVPKDEPPVAALEETSGNLIKISESALYKKYFKMIKFGIPMPAVKQKMISEGFDGSLLDNPDLLIERTPQDDEEQQ